MAHFYQVDNNAAAAAASSEAFVVWAEKNAAATPQL